MRKLISFFILFFSFFLSSQEPLFTLVNAEKTGINFSNNLIDTPDNNIFLYANYYGGSGVGIGEFDNDGYEDIFFAGIHDNGQFCIITRDATKENSEIHHRQPVILPKSQINNYFNLNNNAVEFLSSIKPPELKFHEVSTEVNNPAKNDAILINPIN